MKVFEQRAKQRGVALVTVLIVVALLTILVVAFVVTSQIDHRSSVSFADAQRSKLVAKGAVAHAVEILRNNIPDPAGIDQDATTASATNWVVNPGRLTLIDEQHNEQTVDLHTGAVDVDPESTTDRDVHSVDLNEPIPGKIDPNGKGIPSITYALDGEGISDVNADLPVMRVKWVNILKDPSKPASELNPIIARHAFWMDDESGKINFNTAMGKPDPSEDTNFKKQLDLKLVPPLFSGGEGSIVAVAQKFHKNGDPIERKPRKFGVGNSRSVNLDVLLEDPNDLDTDGLMVQTTLRGFSRYPEAITEFVNYPGVAEKSKWWYENRYNLTSYSRSPEFNVFGRPRLMTTFIPLSLEGGPAYQLPFVYNQSNSSTVERIDGILHLSGLLGTLTRNAGRSRNDQTTDGEDGPNISSRAVVNRYQLEMLRAYFAREFPGYEGSFVGKYGERECAQIALNILAMSRYATSPLAYDATNKTRIGSMARDFPKRLADHLGAVSFSPNDEQAKNLNPERFFWWYEDGKGFLADPVDEIEIVPATAPVAKPMLPVHPGPFITEVRMLFRPEQVSSGDPNTKYRLTVQVEAEYYLPGMIGTVNIVKFPLKTDFISIRDGGESLVKLGLEGSSRDWDDTIYRYQGGKKKKWPRNKRPVKQVTGIGAFRVQKGGNIRPFIEDNPARTRATARSAAIYVAKSEGKVARVKGDAKEFDKEKLSLTIAFRGGLGLETNERFRSIEHEACALQMIPMGITENLEDVLEAEIDIDLTDPIGSSISWQIADPRLSSHKDQWVVSTQDDLDAGTSGELNQDVFIDENGTLGDEPEEESSEKSKFRSVQRGHDVIDGQYIGRGDEMEPNSRVSSKGFWSFISTGVQNQVPWRTLALNSKPFGEVNGDFPPDWVLMDLMGATQPIQDDQRKINATLPDEFSTVSYMHSTTGAINLNTKTYPDNKYFEAPARTKPLEAVFKHLRSEPEIREVLNGIESFQQSRMFRYVGDLAEVNGYDLGETEFERETLLRNMINCLTTKSNTFGVWGSGQVVKKAKGNEKWGEFEDGDSVRGEKRFFAIVERYVWPGKDGVPGNAHVDVNGELDRLAIQPNNIPLEDDSIQDLLFQLPGSGPYSIGGVGRLHIQPKGTYPEFDGPQKVEMNEFASAALGKVVWEPSPLEEAYNPPQAVMKYRVVYFKYLDE